MRRTGARIPEQTELDLFGPRRQAETLVAALAFQAPEPRAELPEPPAVPAPPAPEPEPEPLPAPPASAAPPIPWEAPALGRPAQALYVDAHALLEQAVHAPKLRDSRSPAGVPNGAARAFCKTLLRLLGSSAPEAVAVVFDAPRSAALERRRALVKSYGPDDVSLEVEAQAAVCQQVAALLGCTVLVSPEAEAKDVIGTLVSRTPADWEAIVCSSRTSLLELGQRAACSFSWWRHGAQETIKAAALCRERLRIEPHQVPMFLALSGLSQGLPGLPGIGEATARALVEEFKSAEELMRVTAQGLVDTLLRVMAARVRMPQRVAEQLVEQRPLLLDSIAVATLDRDVHDAPALPESELLPDMLLQLPPEPDALARLGEAWGIPDLTRTPEEPA